MCGGGLGGGEKGGNCVRLCVVVWLVEGCSMVESPVGEGDRIQGAINCQMKMQTSANEHSLMAWRASSFHFCRAT
eukprot:357835-Chlamydomonas_euryale.AAC.3